MSAQYMVTLKKNIDFQTMQCVTGYVRCSARIASPSRQQAGIIIPVLQEREDNSQRS